MVNKQLNCKISIIAAMTKDRVIGFNNKLPWAIKEELQYFKNITLNHVLVMGKNTFASLGYKSLPKRFSIVISSSLSNEFGDNVIIVKNIDEALNFITIKNIAEVMIIGGAKIYEQFIPIADNLYLSIIKDNYPGDTFFPSYAENQFKLEQSLEFAEFTANKYSRLW